MKYYFITCSIFVLLYGIEVTSLSILSRRTLAAPLSLLGSPTTTTQKPLQKATNRLTSSLSRLLGLTSSNPKVDDSNVIKNSDQLSSVKKETIPTAASKFTSIVPDLTSTQDKLNVKPTLPISLAQTVPNTIPSIGIVRDTSPSKSDVTTILATTSPKGKSNPVLLDLQLSDSKSITPSAPDVEDKLAAKLRVVNNDEQQGGKLREMITEHPVVGVQELKVGKDVEREPQINQTVVDAKPEASPIVRILSNLDLNIIDPIKTAIPSNKDVNPVLQTEPLVNKSDDVSPKQEELSTTQSLVPKSIEVQIVRLGNDEQHAEGLQEKVEEDVIHQNVEEQVVRTQKVQDDSEVKKGGQQPLNKTPQDLKSEVLPITRILSKEDLNIDNPSVDPTTLNMSDAKTEGSSKAANSAIQPVQGMLAMPPTESQVIQTDGDSPKQEEQSINRSVFENLTVAGSRTEPSEPLLESADQFATERNRVDIAVLNNEPKLENIRSFGSLHESTDPFAAALNNLFTSELSENTAKSIVTNVESTATRNSIPESSLISTKILLKPRHSVPPITVAVLNNSTSTQSVDESTSEDLFTVPSPPGLTNIDSNPTATNVESAKELVKTPSWTADLESVILPVPLAELKNSPQQQEQSINQSKADSINLVLSEPDTECTEPFVPELKNVDTAPSNNLLDLLSNEPDAEYTASLLPELGEQDKSIVHVETTDGSRTSAENGDLHSLNDIERKVPDLPTEVHIPDSEEKPTVASLPHLSSENSPLLGTEYVVATEPNGDKSHKIDISRTIPNLLAGIPLDNILTGLPNLIGTFERILPNLRVGNSGLQYQALSYPYPAVGPQNYAMDTSIGQYDNFYSYGVAPLIDIHDNDINLVKIVVG